MDIQTGILPAEDVFKICPKCSRTWETREAFLEDASLSLNGYQADFKNIDEGLFYFTHQIDDCFSTLVIETKQFLSLYSGPRHSTPKTGTHDCSQRCFEKGNLERCEVDCEYAHVREVVGIIQSIQKKTSEN